MLQSQTDGHIVHLHSFVEVCIGCKLAAAAACRTAADAMSVSSRFRMINISLRPSGIEAYLDLEEIDTSGLASTARSCQNVATDIFEKSLGRPRPICDGPLMRDSACLLRTREIMPAYRLAHQVSYHEPLQSSQAALTSCKSGPSTC